jgi:hypothetical protein
MSEWQSIETCPYKPLLGNCIQDLTNILDSEGPVIVYDNDDKLPLYALWYRKIGGMRTATYWMPRPLPAPLPAPPRPAPPAEGRRP